VGLLYREPAAGSCSAPVLFRTVSKTGAAPEEIDPQWTFNAVFDGSLLYDDACSPVALRATAAGYVQYVRGADGTWAVEDAGDAAAGGALTQLGHVDAWKDQAGALHVLGMATAGSGQTLLHGTRSGAAGSAWVFEAIPAAAGQVLRYRVGSDGTAHALYKKTEYPCDPCDLGLYYAARKPGGQWEEELVQASKWGAPDDEFVDAPDMEIAADGQPVVAATFQRRVITGSLKEASLRVYARDDGSWCYDTVADTSDGYQGGDGDQFTGQNPDLVLGAGDRPHVVFSDLSEWHSQGMANGVTGQMRHAVLSDGEWVLTTLYSQPGQSDQPKPLAGLVHPVAVVTADPGLVVVAGTATTWETDSIYNQQAVPIGYETLVVSTAADCPVQ
jgi:hypothetical protein